MGTDAIRAAVARLTIEHPDPDRYDHVWNKAVTAALAAIDDAILARQPFEQRVLLTMRRLGRPVTALQLQAALFPMTLPRDRPSVSAALDTLASAGMVRAMDNQLWALHY